MINRHMLVIAVPDLAKSAAFYKSALGFEIQEIGDPGWRFFVKDGVCIMAGECPDEVPANEIGNHEYFAYLVVDDPDAYYEQVKTAGGEIVIEIGDRAWGMREFCLRTVDGHRIVIGSEL